MSAFVNDRDVLIQATVPRFTEITARALLLAASSNIFKVPATGIGEPSAITFTAALLNMSGPVAITTSDGSALSVVGNVATLNFTDMLHDTVTVNALIVVDGLSYPASQTVSKLFDGIKGNSARAAYSKTTLTSLASTPTTLSTAGDTSFPPNGSWGAGTVWESAPHPLAAGELEFKSDGIFNPASGTTTWSVPYLNALKVGQLSAISANIGSITAGDLYAVTIHGGGGYPTSAYAWPTNGGTGFHLSAAGLLMGNPALGQYLQLTAAGDIYAPGFSIVGGSALFSGRLAAPSGTFNLIQSPARVGNAAAAGYDFNGNGFYLYDGVNALPYVELGLYIT